MRRTVCAVRGSPDKMPERVPGQGLQLFRAQFTKYLTIYRKFIVRSTYDSDLKVLKFLLGIA